MNYNEFFILLILFNHNLLNHLLKPLTNPCNFVRFSIERIINKDAFRLIQFLNPAQSLLRSMAHADHVQSLLVIDPFLLFHFQDSLFFFLCFHKNQ